MSQTSFLCLCHLRNFIYFVFNHPKTHTHTHTHTNTNTNIHTHLWLLIYSSHCVCFLFLLVFHRRLDYHRSDSRGISCCSLFCGISVSGTDSLCQCCHMKFTRCQISSHTSHGVNPINHHSQDIIFLVLLQTLPQIQNTGQTQVSGGIAVLIQGHVPNSQTNNLSGVALL